MAKVSIIGYGWLGKAMHSLFPEAAIYDEPLELCAKGFKIGDEKHILANKWVSKEAARALVNQNDMAFIGVPTPSINEGELDTSIIEDIVSWCECPIIVIRSTVNPGFSDYLASRYNKRIVVQPEFLGETPNHPMNSNREFIVLGGEPKDRRELIELYTTVYNANVKIRQLTRLEAEVVKMTDNRAVAFMVAQAQELYDVCELAGVDYYTIREVVYGDDPRFAFWFTFIYPDKRGFNSKCIPKDIYAWCAWAESLGYEPQVTRAILEKNKQWLAL